MRTDEPLDTIVHRTSVRIRTAQSLRSLPVVGITLLVLELGLRDRVQSGPFHAWMALLVISTVTRAAACLILGKRVDSLSADELARSEYLLWASLIFNTSVLGACFWMVAAHGDLTAKFVMTLVSCFYGVGSLVNASNHFSSFAVGVILNLGQGVLFWLGASAGNPAQLEVAVPYAAVALLMLGFGKENAREFRESLRIRKENIELLDQLAAEKVTVEKALHEARLANESKSRFLAAASHDLRQPLHAMTMFLSTLSFHVTTDEARRLLSRTKDTSRVLEGQFNSLLDLSRFDVNAVEPQRSAFRLDALVDEVVEEFRLEADGKQLMLSVVKREAMVWSDRILVSRVLRNLLANAVKYTVTGSIVVRTEEHNGEFFTEVIDTGPGIPDEQQEKVFDEYVQLANPARQRRHGVGLGLAIVRRIDHLLKLRVQLMSAVGLGSRFGFFLPSAAEEGDPTAEGSTLLGVDPLTYRVSSPVWVLDDDHDVLEGLFEQFSAWGAQVETFDQPTPLLERLREGVPPPKWIFTDDMLGSTLSGLETAQILSSEFGFTQVCLLTGNTDGGRLAQLRASGFAVIVKPAQPEALISVLEADRAKLADNGGSQGM